MHAATHGYRVLYLALLFLLAGCAVATGPESSDDVESVVNALDTAGPPTAWWWYYGQSAAQVSSLLSTNQGRLVSLQVESSSPLTFTLAMVKNSGSYAKSWWWYYGQTASQVSALVQQNNARIVDLDAYVVNGTTLFAVVLNSNTGADAKGWWWYYGVTTAQISALVSQNNARLVDLHQYTVNGATRYAVVMVANSGADASAWWWYYNVSAGQVSSFLQNNQAYLISLEPANASGSAFNVIMNRNAGLGWWWYYGLGASDVSDRVSRNGARISDVRTYFVNGARRFTTIMLDNENAETARIGSLLRNATDAEPGLYLKQVNGPVLASLQENFPYDPASSIKILVAVRLLRQLAASGGRLSLSNTTQYIPVTGSSSCPPGSGSAQTQSLGTLLQLMLENSDNGATRSLVDYVGGFAGVNSSAQSLGLTSTQMNVYPGCNISNRATLADLTRLYTGIADGSLLSSSSRSALYARMPADAGDFTGTRGASDQIIDAEASAFGLTASQVSQFKSNFDVHYKAGSDTWCAPDCLDHYSITGIAVVPSCSGSSQSNLQYVWGVFTHAGSGGSAAPAFFGAEAEPLREPIRDALASWASCSP
jgi:Beta-lactamase enzyme family